MLNIIKKNKLPAITFLILSLFPFFIDSYYLNNISYFMCWTFISLGLALIWGMGGVLSFGQTAFFGLAGYSFAVISINFIGTFGVGIWPVFAALLITTLFGFIVGYFLFYGGIYDVFIGIVTLAITLVLETYLQQTAGPEYAIGEARLNGFNGMQGMPTIGFQDLKFGLIEGVTQYYFILVLAIIALIFLYKFKASKLGLIFLASKEDRNRVASLGHNVQKVQLIAFVIASLLAGISGILYTNWGGYITPSSMGLVSAALPVVWVAASGKNDFFAVFIGTVFLVWLSQTLAINGAQFAIIVMGLILVISTRFFPDGIILMVKNKLIEKIKWLQS
jgi:ABC-type branched-subunit amino acid transport system permease subunit